MLTLIPILLVPLAVMIPAKLLFPQKFTLREFLVLEALMIIVLATGHRCALINSVQDVEVWNGRISDKDHGTESCCHCTESCDSDNHCTTSCDHSQDYWWAVRVNTRPGLHERVTIRGCSGVDEAPEAWLNAQIGEAAVVEHDYRNYLLADPQFVLGRAPAESIDSAVPAYPSVFEHYRLRPVINAGTDLPEPTWTTAITEMNADIGPEHHANVIVVATTETSPSFAEALAQSWILGKRNDVVFVLGAPDGQTLQWARVVTQSKSAELRRKPVDEMPGMKLSEVEKARDYIQALVTSHYTDVDAEEFAYLIVNARPGKGAQILLYFFAVLLSVAGSILMIRTDGLRR